MKMKIFSTAEGKRRGRKPVSNKSASAEKDNTREIRLLGSALEAIQHGLGSLPETADLSTRVLAISLAGLDRDIQNAKKEGRWISPFDLFQVLHRTRDEGIHSNILAWLLDPCESHNLGDEFLQGFFRLLGKPSIPAYRWLTVSREYYITEESRLDILVCTDYWWLAMENKIDAYEG
ncbi:MAG: PD-(D/E)XK nuclease family protein, partial [Bryobacteraceae bacterium]